MMMPRLRMVALIAVIQQAKDQKMKVVIPPNQCNPSGNLHVILARFGAYCIQLLARSSHAQQDGSAWSHVFYQTVL